ncbi:MAG: tyrosine-type recombinase/integrase [Gammaproteobacteria bacterium]
MRFTDQQIKKLTPRVKRFEISEDNGNGLWIRVSPSGKKTWVYIYRYQKKLRRLTLGTYPELSISKARQSHAAARSLLKDKGVDPGARKQRLLEAERNADSVSALVEKYIEGHAKKHKRSWREDQRILHKEVIPRWGELKAKDVRRRDIIDLLDDIANGIDTGKVKRPPAPIAANRTLEIIRKMFNYAIERAIIEATPCTMVRAPGKEAQRDRILTQEEIALFWKNIEQANATSPIKIALKFQLVTAQRRGEITLAKWRDFDLESKWWTIPKEDSKNSLSHRVPLSDLAMNLIGELKQLSIDSDFLFPSPIKITGESEENRCTQPIKPGALTRAITRNRDIFGISHFTSHDLRRTAASHMTSIGISRLVVGKLLNHAESGVTAVYDRHSYDAEKQKAMDMWCAKLKSILGLDEPGKIYKLHIPR